MRINRKAFAAAIAPVVAAGALLAPAVASAQPSKGFDVHNNTPYQMKLSLVTGSTEYSGPAVGSVIAPGGSQHFELNYNGPFGKQPTVLADYNFYNGSKVLGWVEAQMWNDVFNGGHVHCSAGAGETLFQCDHPGWDSGDQITFSKK